MSLTILTLSSRVPWGTVAQPPHRVTVCPILTGTGVPTVQAVKPRGAWGTTIIAMVTSNTGAAV